MAEHGLRRSPAKRLYSDELYRGFESHSLRQYIQKTCVCSSADRATDYESVGQRFKSSQARMFLHKDEYFMTLALREARKAYELEEVPVGAVIVYKNEVISAGFNLKEISKNPLAHAEIIAIDRACRVLNRWRLEDTVLYVTLEPCPMCAGAIVQARIKRLVYGTDDPKSGAIKSLLNLTNDERLNHQVEITDGILKDKCRFLLKEFFKTLRDKTRRDG